jgi:hypothetical protein
MNLLLCDKMSLKGTIQPITVHMLYVFRHLNRWSWNTFWGPSWPWSYGSWIYNYLSNQRLSPLLLWVRISIRARCTTLCNKVCQWLAIGRWFSLGPPLSSTNKTDFAFFFLRDCFVYYMYYNRKTWMFLLILIYTILFDIFVYVYVCCANILLLLICFVAVIDFRCIGIIISYAIFIYHAIGYNYHGFLRGRDNIVVEIWKQ